MLYYNITLAAVWMGGRFMVLGARLNDVAILCGLTITVAALQHVASIALAGPHPSGIPLCEGHFAVDS